MKAKAQRTLPNASSKSERFLWHCVRQPRLRPDDLTDVKCGLCWTTNAAYCPCGSELAASHDAEALAAFGSFTFAPQNPILKAWDPEDQRELLAVMRKACAEATWISWIPEMMLRGVVSLCCLAGLTGRASTVGRAGAAAASLRWGDLKADVADIIAAELPVYRGGQHPGPIAPDQVADKIEEIDSVLGASIAAGLMKLMAEWSDEQQTYLSPSEGLRREGMLEFVSAIGSAVDAHVVSGLSHYKAKRIVEMLLLAAYGGLVRLHADPEDLRVVLAVYPLPKNSMTALGRIFPGVRSSTQRREALRLLQKSLKPCRFDVASIIAMLCFWTEQQSGKIKYLA